MIITIDTYGATLDQRNKSFLIRTEARQRQISPHRVQAIHLRKACNVSTPAILLAAKHQIPVLIFANTGKVKARLWQPHFGSLPRIRHQQMLFCKSDIGMAWVQQGQIRKVKGQIAVLQWIANRQPGQAPKLKIAIEKMLALEQQLHVPRQAEALRACEAQLSKHYWKALFRAIAKFERADKRTRQPAQDRVNAMLNYFYGVLYGEVETATLTAGLDPHLGVLHAEQYARPAFVFDAIEPFRPWVDRFVLTMVFNGLVTAACFEVTEDSVRLAKVGKQILIPEFFDWMQERTLFNHKRIQRKDQIQHSLTQLAQYLLKTYPEPIPC